MRLIEMSSSPPVRRYHHREAFCMKPDVWTEAEVNKQTWFHNRGGFSLAVASGNFVKTRQIKDRNIICVYILQNCVPFIIFEINALEDWTSFLFHSGIQHC